MFHADMNMIILKYRYDHANALLKVLEWVLVTLRGKKIQDPQHSLKDPLRTGYCLLLYLHFIQSEPHSLH